ncbi:putative protein OF MAMMALIAN LYST-INTERACTING PROTEIN 5 [Paratrimastix pyriformis]|uniref:Uncharacterized protein n=1 Tax=Paratrimastix pyriformis TaxID=342808 RepID=A0ABQ8UAY8_9EUKA|nr:putative protein OF MAMMALIAN LYST-INTERACTING PROTEIN 5 [Paratrimastix pyriformis]
MSATATPLSLKPLRPYLARAAELDSFNPLMAYYCRMYALEIAMKLRAEQKANDPESSKFLLAMMDRCEKDKASLNPVDADAQVFVIGFAEDVFLKADDEDRAGNATKTTAQDFYAASLFFDVAKQFGDLSPDVVVKQKYAQVKAADIAKAIKEGRKPVAGPPGGVAAPAPSASTSAPDASDPFSRLAALAPPAAPVGAPAPTTTTPPTTPSDFDPYGRLARLSQSQAPKSTAAEDPFARLAPPPAAPAAPAAPSDDPFARLAALGAPTSASASSTAPHQPPPSADDIMARLANLPNPHQPASAPTTPGSRPGAAQPQHPQLPPSFPGGFGGPAVPGGLFPTISSDYFGGLPVAAKPQARTTPLPSPPPAAAPTGASRSGTVGGRPDFATIKEVQKLCKFAGQALEYEDIATARKNLLAALEKLGPAVFFLCDKRTCFCGLIPNVASTIILDLMQPADYDKIIRLYEDRLTKSCHERHIAAIEKMCRLQKGGLPLQDIPIVTKICSMTADHFTETPDISDFYKEAFAAVVRLVGIPFLAYRADEEVNLFDSARDLMAMFLCHIHEPIIRTALIQTLQAQPAERGLVIPGPQPPLGATRRDSACVTSRAAPSRALSGSLRTASATRGLSPSVTQRTAQSPSPPPMSASPPVTRPSRPAGSTFYRRLLHAARAVEAIALAMQTPMPEEDLLAVLKLLRDLSQYHPYCCQISTPATVNTLLGLLMYSEGPQGTTDPVECALAAPALGLAAPQVVFLTEVLWNVFEYAEADAPELLSALNGPLVARVLNTAVRCVCGSWSRLQDKEMRNDFLAVHFILLRYFDPLPDSSSGEGKLTIDLSGVSLGLMMTVMPTSGPLFGEPHPAPPVSARQLAHYLVGCPEYASAFATPAGPPASSGSGASEDEGCLAQALIEMAVAAECEQDCTLLPPLTHLASKEDFELKRLVLHLVCLLARSRSCGPHARKAGLVGALCPYLEAPLPAHLTRLGYTAFQLAEIRAAVLALFFELVGPCPELLAEGDAVSRLVRFLRGALDEAQGPQLERGLKVFARGCARSELLRAALRRDGGVVLAYDVFLAPHVAQATKAIALELLAQLCARLAPARAAAPPVEPLYAPTERTAEACADGPIGSDQDDVDDGAEEDPVGVPEDSLATSENMTMTATEADFAPRPALPPMAIPLRPAATASPPPLQASPAPAPSAGPEASGRSRPAGSVLTGAGPSSFAAPQKLKRPPSGASSTAATRATMSTLGAPHDAAAPTGAAPSVVTVGAGLLRPELAEGAGEGTGEGAGGGVAALDEQPDPQVQRALLGMGALGALAGNLRVDPTSGSSHLLYVSHCVRGLWRLMDESPAAVMTFLRNPLESLLPQAAMLPSSRPRMHQQPQSQTDEQDDAQSRTTAPTTLDVSLLAGLEADPTACSANGGLALLLGLLEGCPPTTAPPVPPSGQAVPRGTAALLAMSRSLRTRALGDPQQHQAPSGHLAATQIAAFSRMAPLSASANAAALAASTPASLGGGGMGLGATLGRALDESTGALSAGRLPPIGGVVDGPAGGAEAPAAAASVTTAQATLHLLSQVLGCLADLLTAEPARWAYNRWRSPTSRLTATQLLLALWAQEEVRLGVVVPAASTGRMDELTATARAMAAPQDIPGSAEVLVSNTDYPLLGLLAPPRGGLRELLEPDAMLHQQREEERAHSYGAPLVPAGPPSPSRTVGSARFGSASPPPGSPTDRSADLMPQPQQQQPAAAAGLWARVDLRPKIHVVLRKAGAFFALHMGEQGLTGRSGGPSTSTLPPISGREDPSPAPARALPPGVLEHHLLLGVEERAKLALVEQYAALAEAEAWDGMYRELRQAGVRPVSPDLSDLRARAERTRALGEEVRAKQMDLLGSRASRERQEERDFYLTQVGPAALPSPHPAAPSGAAPGPTASSTTLGLVPRTGSMATGLGTGLGPVLPTPGSAGTPMARARAMWTTASTESIPAAAGAAGPTPPTTPPSSGRLKVDMRVLEETTRRNQFVDAVASGRAREDRTSNKLLLLARGADYRKGGAASSRPTTTSSSAAR